MCRAYTRVLWSRTAWLRCSIADLESAVKICGAARLCREAGLRTCGPAVPSCCGRLAVCGVLFPRATLHLECAMCKPSTIYFSENGFNKFDMIVSKYACFLKKHGSKHDFIFYTHGNCPMRLTIRLIAWYFLLKAISEIPIFQPIQRYRQVAQAGFKDEASPTGGSTYSDHRRFAV